MAVADPTPDFTSATQPTLQQLVDYFVEAFHDPEKLKRWEHTLTNASTKAGATLDGLATATLDPLLEVLAKFMFAVEDHVETIMGPPLAKLAGHLIGQDVPIAELRRAATVGGGSVVGNAMAKLAMDAMRAPDGEIQPGAERARAFLSVLGQLVVNGWFEGTAFEMITTLFPDMDGYESVAELPHELIDALGLGRLARVALRPLAQIGVATPLQWELHKTHRPTLLTEAQVIREWLRGKWDWPEVEEELARLGYSDVRINALLNEQRKFLGISDVRMLEDHGAPADGDSLKYLGAAGYDQVDAELFLRVEGVKQIDALNTTLIDHIATAFANRIISRAERDDAFNALGIKATRLVLATELADTRLALNKKFLSAAQVADCVKVGILGFTDYRDALTREGYDDAAGAALELLLRHTIDSKRTIAQLKEQQDAERAAAAATRAAAAKQREADAAARALLAKRGSIADNKAAAVRGLIPMSRYAEILAAHYDADTVTAMVGLAEQARQDYLDAQQRRDDAAKRAADRGLNVGQLEAAVMSSVLTLDQFRAGAQRAGVAADDVDILVATLHAKLTDRAAAETKRAEAAQKAATKHASLATIEALVRAGHRTLADYDAFLIALGYDDAGRAAIEELLQTKIDADATAAATRAAVLAADKPRGLTLDQFRRGVILGVKSIADYTSFLVQQKFTTDAISVLVADARDAVAQAAAVQQRRDAVKPRAGSPRLPLAAYTKAARLGLITLDAYRAHLAAIGYSDEDAELDIDELLVEIADTQTKRAAGGADASTVTADVSATLAQAQILRAALDAGLKSKQLSSAELEAAVHDGKLSIEDYISEAEAVGLGAADAELLGARLASQIATKMNAPAPASGTVSRVKKKTPANVP
jgi:hypothetical protein